MAPTPTPSGFCKGLTFSLFFIHVIASPPFACDQSNPSTSSFKFCTTSLSINERVWDLISHLTLEEKVSQLVNTAPAISRLGIPSYQWWSESLHGVSNIGPGIRFNGTIRSATSFPQVILTASSFNREIWYQIGQAAGKEARAIYNAGQANGLTFWAPNINIFRDPRWGRGQETPGEDPTVTGKYAVAYVRGLQGDSIDGSRGPTVRLRASACCKHLTAYDLDKWEGTTRYTFNAAVSSQDLADTYQPPFQRCVEEGHASGIMCAYNRVNGVPNCADYDLLTKTARSRWGFYGYITSDCDAVGIIHDSQSYAATPEDAVGDVLRAGMDVNCGSYMQQHTMSAIQQGKAKESDVNRALHHLFSIRIRLGLFDGNPTKLPDGNIGPNIVCSNEHQYLALQAAREGIVLLKNSPKVLPLSKNAIKSFAVIGPNANNPQTLLGNYAGPPCNILSPLQALQRYVKHTQFAHGCDLVACTSEALIDEAVNVARAADHVVLVMGLDQSQEREELDRVSLSLPGHQERLITMVSQAAKKPVVLVLLCGGPVDVSFAKRNSKIGAMVWAGYPGEAGGTALAEIIFGEHNPGGKLPMTWYPEEFTKIPMTNMRMRPDLNSGYPGRTYRFYRGREVFRYGHGLSYSTYSYEFLSPAITPLYLNLSLYRDPSLSNQDSEHLIYDIDQLGSEACDQVQFSTTVRVRNSGQMDGQHVVLLFSRPPVVSNDAPKRQLVDFKSVYLKAGEMREVHFELRPCEHFAGTLEDGRRVFEGGPHYLMVGNVERLVILVA
ncbi:hypothetical protein AMTRI_Chr04g251510 [Amborella trichopoda]|uniref:Fibronectin type III-like domain-containing protein n=1 Tax=Amborella trichopoda TaxID=13333 RepID=W1NG82_AMBTC|nr:probable beta-D-xylosidase 7 [Amborella trichopoda]ERM94189.1 hypothetical protein AMTR_s00010p00188970 [Amborella trichopoda]|eukprot:XP_006826952.1 probable beta-D-xylosidase 7 [Amborella trichopoda]